MSNVQKWQPSNHTVGDSFISDWCGSCVRGQVHTDRDGVSCDILARTMWLKVEDEDYPAEWCYSEQGNPVCTAYQELDKEAAGERCKHTVDMFNEQ